MPLAATFADSLTLPRCAVALTSEPRSRVTLDLLTAMSMYNHYNYNLAHHARYVSCPVCHRPVVSQCLNDHFKYELSAFATGQHDIEPDSTSSSVSSPSSTSSYSSAHSPSSSTSSSSTNYKDTDSYKRREKFEQVKYNRARRLAKLRSCQSGSCEHLVVD